VRTKPVGFCSLEVLLCKTSELDRFKEWSGSGFIYKSLVVSKPFVPRILLRHVTGGTMWILLEATL